MLFAIQRAVGKPAWGPFPQKWTVFGPEMPVQNQQNPGMYEVKPLKALNMVFQIVWAFLDGIISKKRDFPLTLVHKM